MDPFKEEEEDRLNRYCFSWRQLVVIPYRYLIKIHHRISSKILAGAECGPNRKLHILCDLGLFKIVSLLQFHILFKIPNIRRYEKNLNDIAYFLTWFQSSDLLFCANFDNIGYPIRIICHIFRKMWVFLREVPKEFIGLFLCCY